MQSDYAGEVSELKKLADAYRALDAMGGDFVTFTRAEAETINRVRLIRLGLSLAEIDSLTDFEKHDILCLSDTMDSLNAIAMQKALRPWR